MSERLPEVTRNQQFALSCGFQPFFRLLQPGLYAGTLGNFYSHFSLNCNLTGAPWTELPAAGNIYYLVVPQISTQSLEGGYGKDSSGNQIPFAVPACRPNHLSATICP